jgi:hypothetical protein
VVEVQRFRGTYCLHFRSQWVNQARTQQEVEFVVYSSTLKEEAVISSKRQWTYTGLHGVTSHKIILFMVTAVRTPQATQLLHFCIVAVVKFDVVHAGTIQYLTPSCCRFPLPLPSCGATLECGYVMLCPHVTSHTTFEGMGVIFQQVLAREWVMPICLNHIPFICSFRYTILIFVLGFYSGLSGSYSIYKLIFRIVRKFLLVACARSRQGI